MDESLKQKFLPDEYIFKQGEKGNQAYLLLDGRIAVEVNGEKVLKPSIVLPIDEKILAELLEKSPPIVKSMVKQLSYRLAQCDAEIRSLRRK